MDVFDDEDDDGAAAQTSSLKTWKPLVLENGTQELLWWWMSKLGSLWNGILDCEMVKNCVVKPSIYRRTLEALMQSQPLIQMSKSSRNYPLGVHGKKP